MGLSEILNLILGGGLIAALISLITIRATVRKANADADKAKADAETVRISNTEQATRILIENIVEPLKEELIATRNELCETKKELGATKREMARFRKAVNDANGCKYHDDCPVLVGLREFPKVVRNGNGRHSSARGQHRVRSPGNKDGNHTDVGSDPEDTDGQPP